MNQLIRYKIKEKRINMKISHPFKILFESFLYLISSFANSFVFPQIDPRRQEIIVNVNIGAIGGSTSF